MAATGDPERPPLRSGVIVGAVAGLLSGLFGIGGGIVIVPGLMALAAMDRRLAHGTSLAATLPIALASAVTFASSGSVDGAVMLPLAAGSIVGAVVGTHLLQILDKRVIVVVFVVVILATAIRLVVTEDVGGRDALTPWTLAALIAIGLVAGVLAGLLGIGGGVVMVPAMIVLFSIDPVVAKGTSVAVIVPTSIAGTIRNRTKSNADLRAALAVGVAGVATAVVGSIISASISDAIANTMFAALLVVVAALQLRTIRPSAPS